MEKLEEFLPWGKIAVPVLPVLFIDIYLGRFIKQIYIFNVNNNIQNQFPTSNTFCIFLSLNLFMIAVYLLLSAYSHINKERLDALKGINRSKSKVTQVVNE